MRVRRGGAAVAVPVIVAGVLVPAAFGRGEPPARVDDLKARGVTPKYIYTIPTVQNPTGAIMGVARRKALLALARKGIGKLVDLQKMAVS